MIGAAIDRDDRTREVNRRRSGDHGMGAEDNFITGPETGGANGKVKTIGSVADAQGISGAC